MGSNYTIETVTKFTYVFQNLSETKLESQNRVKIIVKQETQSSVFDSNPVLRRSNSFSSLKNEQVKFFKSKYRLGKKLLLRKTMIDRKKTMFFNAE